MTFLTADSLTSLCWKTQKWPWTGWAVASAAFTLQVWSSEAQFPCFAEIVFFFVCVAVHVISGNVMSSGSCVTSLRSYGVLWRWIWISSSPELCDVLVIWNVQTEVTLQNIRYESGLCHICAVEWHKINETPVSYGQTIQLWASLTCSVNVANVSQKAMQGRQQQK